MKLPVAPTLVTPSEVCRHTALLICPILGYTNIPFRTVIFDPRLEVRSQLFLIFRVALDVLPVRAFVRLNVFEPSLLVADRVEFFARPASLGRSRHNSPPDFIEAR